MYSITAKFALRICFILSLGMSCLVMAAERPNFVLCMADDHGFGDTGYNGNTLLRTPHLDQMAKDGMQMDRFYAASPVCSPTRGSFLTGRHPTRYGIPYANTGKMKDDEITMAEALKTLGYRTGHFGKWHLGTMTTAFRDSNRGGPGSKNLYSPPWLHGFDVCYSTEAKVPTFWEEGSYESYGTKYWIGAEKPITEPITGDDSAALMTPALEFITDSVANNQPFVAVVWFHTPHKPYVLDPNHSEGYGEKASYYSGLSALDEQMGRLRTHLKDLGVADNTVVFYTSDNGPEKKTPGDSGGLRMRKRSLYEGGIRVPGLMVWPSVIQPGTVSQYPASTSDLLPTVMELAGGSADSERPLDGISLQAMINGEQNERATPIAFSCPRSGQQALIDNQWKLYRGKSGKDELYNLHEDRGEEKNIAKQHPDRVANMRQILDDFVASCAESSRGKDYKLTGIAGLEK